MTGTALKQTVAPTEEPCSIEEVKQHLRIDGDDENSLLMLYMKAAREYAETFTRRAFVTQTWKLTLDSFPSHESADADGWIYTSGPAIVLPLPPVVSVSSITYVDENSQSQTLSSALYTLDDQSEPGRILPAFNQSWPTTRSFINSVAVTFVCGYGAASAVPTVAKQAILLMVGSGYEHRENILAEPGMTIASLPAADNLLNSLRWGSYI